MIKHKKILINLIILILIYHYYLSDYILIFSNYQKDYDTSIHIKNIDNFDDLNFKSKNYLKSFGSNRTNRVLNLILEKEHQKSQEQINLEEKLKLISFKEFVYTKRDRHSENNPIIQNELRKYLTASKNYRIELTKEFSDYLLNLSNTFHIYRKENKYPKVIETIFNVLNMKSLTF